MILNRSLVRVVGIALVSSLLALPSFALASDPEWVTLRVVTLNVKDGLGVPGDSVYEAVGDMITVLDDDPGDIATGLNPDVVCFQELNAQARSQLETFRDEFLPGYQISANVGSDGFNYNATLVAPGIEIVSDFDLAVGNPRAVRVTVLDVPGSDEFVKVYNAHFKAFGDDASQATRRSQADNTGSEIARDTTDGFVTGVPLENQHVLMVGDLNSSNNADGTLDGLYETVSSVGACCAPADGSADAAFQQFLGLDCSGPDPCCIEEIPAGFCAALGGIIEQVSRPTGLSDVVYETLLSQDFPGTGIIATFRSSNSRLDYINATTALAMRFDTDGDETLGQDERNAIGFVYRAEELASTHERGQFANGNASASFIASDHTPVVATWRFRPEAVNLCAADFNGDGTVDGADFGVFGMAFGVHSGDALFDARADLNADGAVDGADFGLFGSDFGRDDCLP
jgi:endonuclease/exonuclease/phosphatase family metal-dependent hydrolase